MLSLYSYPVCYSSFIQLRPPGIVICFIRVVDESSYKILNSIIGVSVIKDVVGVIGRTVISIECNYKKTTTFPDEISVDVKILKLSACKLTFGYTFTVRGEVVFTASSSHCFLDKNGSPVILEKAYPQMYTEFKKFLA